ncbi:MAG: YbjN domain-containing protein [Acidobacteriia bacterium]|nr:YbjN domain-containing protein [Terriglobia bacterium]
MKKLAIGLLLSLALCAAAQSQECTSKLQGFVNNTGYKIKVAKACQVWVATDALTIPQGDGLAGLLLIGQEGEMGVVGTVVQTKAQLNLSADLLMKLMQMNNELDFVKVGIDNDGDLFVRSELRMASLTAEDFKASVKNVVDASSKIYSLLKK